VSFPILNEILSKHAVRNPHADLQAQDRAHRIGQTKAVRILRFITEKSVEEAMFARARFKLGMDEKVIQAGRFDNKSNQEDSDDLLRAILEADNEDDGTEESGIMNDDEINEIIARSDEEVIIFREMDVERERLAEERWRAAGNRGPRPPSLMTLEELPAYWQTDEVRDAKDDEILIEGRGARKRQAVNYSDGLTDEQFAMVRHLVISHNVVDCCVRHWKKRRIWRKPSNGTVSARSVARTKREATEPTHREKERQRLALWLMTTIRGIGVVNAREGSRRRRSRRLSMMKRMMRENWSADCQYSDLRLNSLSTEKAEGQSAFG
jgi:hypothetical protein